MRKIIIYILAFMLFTFLGGQSLDMVIARQIENAPPYCLSFASIGAIFLESRFDAWAKINATPTNKSIDALLDEIGYALNLPGNAVLINENNPSKRSFEWRDGRVEFKINIVQQTATQGIAQVSIVSAEPSVNILKYKSLLDNLKDYSWNYNYSYCGEICAIFNPESMDILIDTVLKNLHADAYERSGKGDSWNVKAKGNRLPGGIEDNTIEFAIRKVEYGKTRVWLGFPALIHPY